MSLRTAESAGPQSWLLAIGQRDCVLSGIGTLLDLGEAPIPLETGAR